MEKCTWYVYQIIIKIMTEFILRAQEVKLDQKVMTARRDYKARLGQKDHQA